MSQGVLVTGAGGFVGGVVVNHLLAQNTPVVALTNRRKIPEKTGLRCVYGDLLDTAVLDQAMAGCRAVIHLVGIIRENPAQGATYKRIHFEGTRAIVAAAQKNGVRRLIHMSAQGARPDAPAEYHRTKYQAEECVRGSGLNWTIFRPSLIHGPDGEFMQMECAWAKGKAAPYLFMPYFGAGLLGLGGAGLLEPVFVEDVARAFVQALDNPKSISQVYPLGGGEQLTWPQMHRLVAQAVVGHPRLVAAIPAWYAKLLTRIVPAALLPFNRDQVLMSQEDNTCDITQFRADFGWAPRTFSSSVDLSCKTNP
jgi:NADH dehydrogenase